MSSRNCDGCVLEERCGRSFNNLSMPGFRPADECPANHQVVVVVCLGRVDSKGRLLIECHPGFRRLNERLPTASHQRQFKQVCQRPLTTQGQRAVAHAAQELVNGTQGVPVGGRVRSIRKPSCRLRSRRGPVAMAPRQADMGRFPGGRRPRPRPATAIPPSTS